MKIPAFRAAIIALALISTQAFAEDEKKIELTGNDQMKYNLTAFEVKTGQKVVVTLTNIGKLPKLAMGHNFVLLKSGHEFAPFAAAAASHAKEGYMPPELADQVIAATKLAGPGETETVTFTAPAAGKYEYLCTFPAHATVGMHGVMTVN